jgi:restriction system protein
MANPDFQSFMLPVVQSLASGEIREKSDIIEDVVKILNLSDEDRKELLPSGTEPIYRNRIGWSLSYLKHAGLIHSPGRAVYQITERGKGALEKNLPKINARYLKQYPEFLKFIQPQKKGTETVLKSSSPENEDKTPLEYIEYGFQQIKDELKETILNQVKACSPFYFEKIVIDLLLAMGYGGSRAEAGQVTQKTGDGGIDGIINEDKLGLDVIYIQAKRWENPVSRPEIQKFAGALMGKKAKKGIFITTSYFTREAQEFSQSIDSKIILIDGERLAKLMIEHNVGVVVGQTYEIKRMDSDYFIEE